MGLSQDQIDGFHRDGFVFPLRVLTTERAAHYLACLEAHEARAGQALQGNMRHKTHLLFTWVDELAHHPDILDAVADIIGPNVLLWNTNFFIKEAANPGFVSWHQDSTYWGLEPDDVVTAWVALTDATPDNGYMQFLPGSHRREQLPHLDTFHRDNLLSRGQEIAVEVDKSKAVGVGLKAGEMSLHHIKLVHGSAPNHSAGRRVGVALRYIPTHVRQTKLRDSAMLVRGVDEFHYFDEEARPQADLDDAAVASHAEAMARQVKALYEGTDKQAFRP